jgi:hypothetical protein
MRDKRFAIALAIIIVLAVALLYMTVVGPKIDGYVVSKQAQAQENVVNAILQVVDQQGYVAIGDGENSVVLYSPDYINRLASGAQQAQPQIVDASGDVVEGA